MLRGSLLALSLITAGDAPKAPDRRVEALTGQWDLFLATDGTLLLNQFNIPFTIGDKKITWTKLPYLTNEKGESKLAVDSSKSPPTIELKVGAIVHKGIYRFRTSEDGKTEYLDLLFARPGGKLPRAFGESGILFNASRIK
jgi:hypothetical protein